MQKVEVLDYRDKSLAIKEHQMEALKTCGYCVVSVSNYRAEHIFHSWMNSGKTFLVYVPAVAGEFTVKIVAKQKGEIQDSGIPKYYFIFQKAQTLGIK